LCSVSIWTPPSGNFDTFIMKLEVILNILFQNQFNLVICGDFNVNFMINNIKKYKITSFLGSDNLDYIVDFPTRINTYSALTIDNIFLNKSRNKNCIINHTIMDYSNMML
jgi:hypothetical protein